MKPAEPLLKRSLKRLRVSQPFNYLATSGVRALLRATDGEPALAAKHLHRAGTVRCTLANGRTMTAPVVLDRLSIGPITFTRVSALVAKPGLLTDNLLGQSVLGRLESYEVRGNRLVLRARKS